MARRSSGKLAAKRQVKIVMRLSMKELHQGWIWTMAPAIALFLILSALDDRLRTLSGFGVHDIQAPGHWRGIFAGWLRPDIAASAGFILGLDYVFLISYGVGFYLSGVIVREAFAPHAGVRRRLADMACLVPLLGALFGALANALEMWMLTHGTAGPTAFLAGVALHIRIYTFWFGLVLFAAALLSRFRAGKSAA
jgi:hypothetical protein